MKLGAYDAKNINDFITKDIPSRSTLINLEPISIVNSNRESLSSYFMRLSDAHSVAPTTFAKYITSATKHSNTYPTLSTFCSLWKYPCFVGIGETASTWVTILQELTKCNLLKYTTLLPLQLLIPDRHVLARQRKWCPLCLTEDLQTGPAYLRLLWAFKEVAACPKHMIKLQQCCGHNHDHYHKGTRPRRLPNICPNCGRNLAVFDMNNISAASKLELVNANLVANLLESRIFDNNDYKPEGTVNDFIQEAMAMYADGYQNRLGFILGKRKNIIQGWATGSHQPTFQHVVALAHAFQCSLEDVLTGRIANAHSPSAMPTLDAPIIYKRLDPPRLKRELEKMLEDLSPITVAEASRRLGTTRFAVRYHFPDLCKALTARCRELKLEARLASEKTRLADYRQAARSLAMAGQRPTRNKVQIFLGGRYAVFNPRDRKACESACIEAIREFGLDEIPGLEPTSRPRFPPIAQASEQGGKPRRTREP